MIVRVDFSAWFFQQAGDKQPDHKHTTPQQDNQVTRSAQVNAGESE
jgi:hypothetical protein